MKKLYNNKSGRIHPSPPPLNSDDQFSLLPAAIMTLAAALSPQDKEVLAYLISCSSSSPNSFSSAKSTSKVIGSGSGGDHPAEFHCDCFRCYMSYWVRWDASPNRQLIHEIIEAYEDGFFIKKQAVVRSKKERKRRVAGLPGAKDDRGSGEPEPVEVMDFHDQVDRERINEDGELGNYSESGVSTVRKLVSFMGERIWGVWGII